MSTADLNVPSTRRVITGHDRHKKAKVLRDDVATNISTRTNASSTTIWYTDAVPVHQQGDEHGEDMGARRLNSGTPPNGTRLMIMDLFAGAQGAMHRTDTVDYVIAIEGEVEMMLDGSSVTLRAGDVLVQQGTKHAWVNKSGKPCRICFVLIDSEVPPAWKKDWKPK